MTGTIQLSFKDNKVSISCPATHQTINITIPQARTLYKALRYKLKQKQQEKAA